MTEETEFDEFKDSVYRDIRWLEFCEKDLKFKRRENAQNSGCLGAVFSGVFGGMFRVGRHRMKQYRKVAELRVTATEILDRPAVKKAICEVLDDSVRLPIDVANAITPVLYQMKAKHNSVPRDSMLYAIISKQIADEGVEKFCM